MDTALFRLFNMSVEFSIIGRLFQCLLAAV